MLLADAKIPTGKHVYVDDISVTVNGGTAWTDTTGTKVELQDTANVVFAGLAKAQMTGNAIFYRGTSGLTVGAGFWAGGTANKGLQLLADHSFAAGSTLTVRIRAHLA